MAYAKEFGFKLKRVAYPGFFISPYMLFQIIDAPVLRLKLVSSGTSRCFQIPEDF